MALVPTKILGHTARALARLATQFRDKPKIAALIGVFTTEVQAIENMLYDVLIKGWLADAVGDQLDMKGRLVGQDRENSVDDDEYRLRISARIRANLSTGSPEDLYTVFRILLPTHTLSIEPYYPAAIVMEALEAIDPDLVPLYQQFFAVTLAGGVGGQFVYSESTPATTFTLSNEAAAPETSALTGFGDDGDPATGGHLAGVFAG